MEELLIDLLANSPLVLLFGIIAALLFVLGKGADLLVDEAVTLSVKAGLNKVIIGATIISLGTTAPETAVSVMAAIRGEPGIALGNAVGSIIANTGLILGLVALLSPPLLNKDLMKKQGNFKFFSAGLLVLLTFPYARPGQVFSQGGVLSQLSGFILVFFLLIYFYLSFRWSKDHRVDGDDFEVDHSGLLWVVIKLFAGLALVIVASHFLIPTVKETAGRLGVPENIIAATLVAFGTSLPELITAITAVRKGHAELAVGNIIGADILNALFVAGLSAAVTPLGLSANNYFFQILFPGMFFVLIVFRIGAWIGKTRLPRWTSFFLLGGYVTITILGYTFK
jgi:cation:H+ antiporter